MFIIIQVKNAKAFESCSLSYQKMIMATIISCRARHLVTLISCGILKNKFKLLCQSCTAKREFFYINSVKCTITMLVYGFHAPMLCDSPVQPLL